MTEVEKYEYGINHQIKTCTQHISEILIQHEYYQNIYIIIYTIHNIHLVHIRMKMGDHSINRLHTDFIFQSQFHCIHYLNISYVWQEFG